MNVLTFTSLYPNAVKPNACVFVKHRMEAVAHLPGNAVRVVAPVPYCPPLVKREEWRKHGLVPGEERQGTLAVYHPRYPLLPRVSMQVHWLLMLAGVLATVKKLHGSFRFDLIDGHFIYPDGLTAVALARILRIPVVLSARGSDIHEFSTYPTIRPLIRRALCGADALIAVCAALEDRMLELGAPADKITVIPNGVDAGAFPLVDRQEARASLGLPSDGKIIVSVGALIELKGHHVTIEAMRGVLAAVPGARLYIIGAGPYRPKLEACIREHRLAEHVVLLGERPNRELYLWYNAANCSCLASSREGWANVIMESLACGTPVVATNVWGAPEILTTPEVGLLSRRRPDDLCEDLSSALIRDWDRGTIREHVARRTWAAVGREVQGVFDKVSMR